MIPELKKMEMPQWLSQADAITVTSGPFPLKEILADSLYYPCSAFDGVPVRILAGNFFSFIYVDYGYTEHDLDNELNVRGFNGYEIVASRDLTKEELAPEGWTPLRIIPEDGNPKSRGDWVKQPFAKWTVFQRKADVQEDHGPERFSLIYLCADGAAAFQALYLSNRVVPKAVAIIQPGISFGGNWTDFRSPELIFGRLVLGNPAGKPEYLLLGKWESCPECGCWPKYSKLVWQQRTRHQHMRLWKMSSATPVSISG